MPKRIYRWHEEVEEAKEVKEVEEETNPASYPMLRGNATRFTVSEWSGQYLEAIESTKQSAPGAENCPGLAVDDARADSWSTPRTGSRCLSRGQGRLNRIREAPHLE